MNANESILADLTDDQCARMKRLICAGKLDFDIHQTNPGEWSHDIGILVDHDDLTAAISDETNASDGQTHNVPAEVRQSLVLAVEDIGSALGLLREASTEPTEQLAKIVADDAVEILGHLEAQFSALTAKLAMWTASSDAEN